MSFAPRDTHEAQVQFALERGVPAMIGVMATQRLPYPARAFDMAHCSRCLIPWQAYGNLSYYQTLTSICANVLLLTNRYLWIRNFQLLQLFVSFIF